MAISLGAVNWKTAIGPIKSASLTESVSPSTNPRGMVRFPICFPFPGFDIMRFLPILALMLIVMSAFGLYAKAVTSDDRFRQAQAALEAGDPAAAVALWRPLAEAGDPDAMYRLGRAFMYGDGVVVDYAAAHDWLGKAAEAGQAAAQKEFGKLYDRGWGVDKDLSLALEWYQKSADQGYSEAQHNLGAMAYFGMGRPKDLAQAAVWYRRAAEQGLAVSEFSLATLLLEGEGLVRDPGEAAEWLEKAVAQDYAPAMLNLADLLFSGDGVAKDPERAKALLNRAATLGQPQARFRLGLLALADGDATKADPVGALVWFTLAADLDHGDAVAVAKRLSQGMSSDDREAARAQVVAYRKAHPIPR